MCCLLALQDPPVPLPHFGAQATKRGGDGVQLHLHTSHTCTSTISMLLLMLFSWQCEAGIHYSSTLGALHPSAAHMLGRRYGEIEAKATTS